MGLPTSPLKREILMKYGKVEKVLVSPETSNAANHAFDVTPARLVTGFITERGVCRATESDIMSLFPDKKSGKKMG